MLSKLSNLFVGGSSASRNNFYVDFERMDMKIKSLKLLSEGAFAFVYLARQSP